MIFKSLSTPKIVKDSTNSNVRNFVPPGHRQERKEDRIRTRLYEAYQKSDRSLDEIMAFMEGRDDEIDW